MKGAIAIVHSTMAANCPDGGANAIVPKELQFKVLVIGEFGVGKYSIQAYCLY